MVSHWANLAKEVREVQEVCIIRQMTTKTHLNIKSSITTTTNARIKHTNGTTISSFQLTRQKMGGYSDRRYLLPIHEQQHRYWRCRKSSERASERGGVKTATINGLVSRCWQMNARTQLCERVLNIQSEAQLIVVCDRPLCCAIIGRFYVTLHKFVRQVVDSSRFAWIIEMQTIGLTTRWHLRGFMSGT